MNLVYYASKAKHRLELLSHLGGHEGGGGVSIHTLSMPSREFARVFYSGSDRGRTRETAQFLAQLLDHPEEAVKERLSRHPHAGGASLLNARRVSDHLLSRGVSKEQLWYGLQVVLYDAELVSVHLSKLCNQDELQPYVEWRDCLELMELLIYYMERETRFVGATKLEVFSSPVAEESSSEDRPIDNLYFNKNWAARTGPKHSTKLLTH